MRIFVYEFVTAGGFGRLRCAPPASLVREGEAMVGAVAEDFCLLAGAEVWVMGSDGKLPLSAGSCRVFSASGDGEEMALFSRLAAQADATLLIAPETGGELLRRCRAVEAAGGRLLSPASACIELTADKQATALHLARHGLRVPQGVAWTGQPTVDWGLGPFPWIAKPIDGCGSQGIRMVKSRSELLALPRDGSLRVEGFVAGRAASVAVISGPAGDFALPACEQRLSNDGRFEYLGGRLLLEAEPARRAERLALAAVAALPGRRGYVGVDLVLGEAAIGSQDHVIEVNPRLTTSYVGLRAASRTNLAAAMFAACSGASPSWCFDREALEFDADGAIRKADCRQGRKSHELAGA